MCIIHIGLHHTGTTSLQTLLNDNNTLLERFGIVYPSSIKHGIQHSLLPGSFLPDHFILPKTRNLDPNFHIKKLRNELDQKEMQIMHS